MKRLFSLFIAAIMLLSLTPYASLCEAGASPAPETVSVPAEDAQNADASDDVLPDADAPDEDMPEPSASETQSDPFASITTPYIYLVEADSGALLYSRNGDARAFPASTTKIMTALVAIENLPDLNKVVTLGWRPVAGFGPTSSLMGLEVGEQVSIIDMLYGLLMHSGNDAAKALAIETSLEHFGSQVDLSDAIPLFVQLMNEKAQALGMNSTHFATIDGRHDPEHYTTAHDFSILMSEALKNPVIAQIIATPTYQVQSTNIHPNGFYFENSNRLICTRAADTEAYLYESCIGGKTGETNEAGYCLLSAARRDGVTLILVQFGDSNKENSSFYRYQTAPIIYDWGFRNYRAFELTEFDVTTEFTITAENCSPFDSENGVFTAKADIDGLSITGAYTSIRTYMEHPDLITMSIHSDYSEAPIRKGDVVGYVEYHFYDNAFIRANLIAQRDVAAASDVHVEPHETVFIPVSPPHGSGRISALSLRRDHRDESSSVWVYHDSSLYTKSSSEWHYLNTSDASFRTAASEENVGKVTLYRRCFDSNGDAYYQHEDFVSDGEYVIVVNGMALSTSSKNGSLAGIPVSPDANGIITDGVDSSMYWNFECYSNGYLISNAYRYLSRKGSSGVLFWVLILILALAAIILIRLIAIRRKKHSRRHRNAKRYRGSLM